MRGPRHEPDFVLFDCHVLRLDAPGWDFVVPAPRHAGRVAKWFPGSVPVDGCGEEGRDALGSGRGVHFCRREVLQGDDDRAGTAIRYGSDHHPKGRVAVDPEIVGSELDLANRYAITPRVSGNQDCEQFAKRWRNRLLVIL